MKIKNAGFTLIELLVVIAIIGLLSAVVMASLSSARLKGRDAAIKQAFTQMRSQSLIYFDTHKHFGTTFLAAPATITSYSVEASCGSAGPVMNVLKDMFHIISEAERNSNPSSTWVARCAVGRNAGLGNATSWAVSVRLASDSSRHICIDHNNEIKLDSYAIGGGSTTTNPPASCS